MVIALVGLIFILLLVFVLIIRGQSRKYAKKTDPGEPGPPAPPAGRAFACLPPFWRGVGGRRGQGSLSVSLCPSVCLSVFLFLCPRNVPALIGGAAWPSHTIFIFYFGFNSKKEKGEGQPSQGEGKPPELQGWSG